MKITNELIKSYRPCADRYNNYLNHYSNTEYSIIDFLKLENITYDDKIWVWKKFASKNDAVLFGLKCADSVLSIYEDKYPDDKRPRNAIDAVKVYLDNPSEENKQKCKEAAAAAYAAAAYAAAAYAADAADAAAYAADAAAYAAADAAYAAYAAYANVRKLQQDKNLSFLIEIYEGK